MWHNYPQMVPSPGPALGEVAGGRTATEVTSHIPTFERQNQTWYHTEGALEYSSWERWPNPLRLQSEHQ